VKQARNKLQCLNRKSILRNTTRRQSLHLIQIEFQVNAADDTFRVFFINDFDILCFNPRHQDTWSMYILGSLLFF